jgi:hypothetical protein
VQHDVYEAVQGCLGLCLAALCLLSVFAFGAGSASAAGPLFKSTSGFPYHLEGLRVSHGLLSTLGHTVLSTAVHALALILSSTLFDLHLLFLGVTSPGPLGTTAKCGNTNPASEDVLMNLLGHLGLAHHRGGGVRHAILLLLEEGFSFVCEALGVQETVKLSGSMVGEINKPAAGVEATELNTSVKQSLPGHPLYTLFLFTGGGQIVPLLLIKEGGGALEQAALEEGEAIVKLLPGLNPFLLILD